MGNPLTTTHKMVVLNWYVTTITILIVIMGVTAAIAIHNHENSVARQHCLDKGWFWVQFKAAHASGAAWTCLEDPTIADH